MQKVNVDKFEIDDFVAFKCYSDFVFFYDYAKFQLRLKILSGVYGHADDHIRGYYDPPLYESRTRCCLKVDATSARNDRVKVFAVGRRNNNLSSLGGLPILRSSRLSCAM